VGITAFFDGACAPCNPGGTASFGAVIFDGECRIWECSRVFRPIPGREHETSNNIAEYCGFLAILEQLLADRMDDRSVTIYGDSNLVIQQMLGNWRIRQGFYVATALEARATLTRFRRKPALVWLPREYNTIADELSKAELLNLGIDPEAIQRPRSSRQQRLELV
jgi:ribonuclease HI